WGVLRIPGCALERPDQPGLLSTPAAGEESRLRPRRRIRGEWRGLRPRLLRDQPRADQNGNGPDRGVSRGEQEGEETRRCSGGGRVSSCPEKIARGYRPPVED